MNEMRFNKLKTSISFLAIGALAVVSFVAFGQTDTTTPAVVQGNVGEALKDLSAVFGQEVANVTQAKTICNQEKYLSDCAEIGKKHQLFKADEIKQVDAVLTELKGKIVEDLKNCATEECLVGVASRLAKNLAQKNPTIARQLDLTTAKVEEKNVVVMAAKEAGVNISECRAMDPDTAPIELLRACAKLAKNQKVQKVLTKEAREAVAGADVSLQLREALVSGEVQCGDNTPEGCGNYCLNTSAEARAQGASAIPAVCRQIAAKFFGQDGVKQLEQSYGQVNQTFEYYKKRSENVVFTTIDGKTLTDPAEVGKYLEEQGRNGNVDAVSKGLDFMIAKGFVTLEDKKFALEMVQQAKDKGGSVDFDRCAQNPETCREFVPQNNLQRFDAFREIELVMKAEMAPRGISDPRQCDQSDDPKIGEACLAGAKAALPKIEAIAVKFPQARFIVQEIKQHIQFGDQGLEARKNVEEKFKGGQGITIGGQQFNNFQQVQQFCEKNGQLCLADAAKEGFIKKDYAAQKYEQSFEAQFRNQGGFPGSSGFPGGSGQFPGSPGGFPGGPGGFPQQGGFFPSGGGSGQFPGSSGGFPGGFPGGPSGSTQFNKEDALKQFQQWLDNPRGAPPIPNQFGPQQFQGQFPGGPQGGFPGGQFGPQACPTLATVNECPAGRRKVVAYSSSDCGVYYKCEGGEQPLQPSCPQDQYWNGSACVGRYGGGACPSNQYWFVPPGGGSGYCKYYGSEGQPGPQQGCLQGQYWFVQQGGSGYCKPYESPSPCQSGQYWNGTACVTGVGGNCSSDQYWSIAKDGHGFCQSKSSVENCGNGIDDDGDQFIDQEDPGCGGSATPPGGGGSCPSGQYWYVPSGGGAGYCQSSSSNLPTDQASCASKGYKWCTSSSSSGWCQSGACPAGDYPYTGDTNSCPGFAYSRWDNTNKKYCQLNSERKCDYNYPSYLTNGTNYKVENCPAESIGPTPTPPPGGSSVCDSALTALLGTGCHQMYTDSSGNHIYCDGPMSKSAKRGDSTTTSSCSSPGGTPSCPSGQWWNGTACTSGGGTTSGTCDSTLTGLLGSGCHNMGNAYFDSAMTRYVWPNTTAVKECTASWVSGCTTGSSTGTVCPSSQYWNGSACVAQPPPPPPGGCPSGQYWNGSACVTSTTPPGGATACSDGIDNDGDGKIDYPADTGCYGPSDPDEIIPPSSGSTCPSFAHEMSGFCMLNNDTSRCASYSNASTEANYTSAQCGSGTTSATCPTGQYWNGSSCVTSTTSGNCPSGQYWYVPPGSTTGSCTSNPTPPPSGTTCPSGQWWNGSSCTPVTSPPPTTSSCPSGQYWYYPSGGGTGYCVSNTTPPPSSTTCPSGQYWSGTACVSSTTPPPTTSTSCTGGQYWSGSLCVCSSGTTWNGSSCVSACSSGQYWNGTSCVSSTTTPPPTTPPPTTTTCPSGYHLEGSTCYPDSTTPPPTTPPPTTPPPTTPPPTTPPPTTPPPPPPTSFFFRSSNCPSNHTWNGAYCVMKPQYTAHFFATMATSLRGITGLISTFFR